MLQRRRRKNKSSTHPSTTFINNLLHSKSTYFYKWWGEKNSTLSSKWGVSNRLAYSCLVPSVCILALLVGLYSFVNPTIDLDNDANKAYAEGAADIAPYAITPTLSLNIGGAGADETVNAYTGTVAYRAHSVNVVASDIKSYSLMLTGPAKLINGTTELTGAGGRIPDGTGDSAMLDNTWGYYYGTDSNQANVAYNSLTGSAQTLDSSTMHTSSSDNASTGAVVNGSTNFTKNLVFVAKFGNTATAGHYTGNVTLSLVAEAKTVVEYSITYNKNTTDTTVTNMPTPNPQQISDESGGSSITTTLSSTIPTRTGYTFKGWSTSSSATTAQYQPNSTITLQESNKDITLYAVWEKKPVIFNGITTMQQMTADICKNAKENDSAQLTDTRDNKKYWVTKLKDGNCWMTQNLDYDGGGTEIVDLTKWSIDQGMGNSKTAYYDPGNYYYNGPNGSHAQGTDCTTVTGLQECLQFSTNGDEHYHVGNYYTGVMAATYGSTLCPKNWQVPLSGENNNEKTTSFYNLLKQYGLTESLTGTGLDGKSYSVYMAPLYFVYGGQISGGELDRAGSRGGYWSQTNAVETTAYGLYLSGSVDPSRSATRYYGRSVRCLVAE